MRYLIFCIVLSAALLSDPADDHPGSKAGKMAVHKPERIPLIGDGFYEVLTMKLSNGKTVNYKQGVHGNGEIWVEFIGYKTD